MLKTFELAFYILQPVLLYIFWWEDSVSLVLKWLMKTIKRRLRKFLTVTHRNDGISNRLLKIPWYVTYTAQGLHWTVILVEKPRIHKAIISCTLQGRGRNINTKQGGKWHFVQMLPCIQNQIWSVEISKILFPIMPSLSTCVPLWWTHLMNVLKQIELPTGLFHGITREESR